MYILYSLLLAAALLLSFPWWALQVLRLGKYRSGLRERLGFVPSRLRGQAGHSIWIHAVSVGEVLAVSHLVAELQKRLPRTPVFISTTTATGQKLARDRFGRTQVFYLPLDFGFAIRAYQNALCPHLLILAEAEFWPNLLHLSRKRGLRVAIVNARISDRSLPRYRRFRWFFSKVLGEADLFLAQTETDAQRLREIGAATDCVHVSGNLKFDVRSSAASPLAEDLGRAVGRDALIIVCGSTTEGEEEVLLAAFRDVRKQFPSAVLVLAPRHPERFDKVAALVSEQGFTVIRRSLWTAKRPVSGGVFLLDSVGELASVYALASVAFVGGSLLPGVGGHNILEPAQYGVPVMSGPNTANFREIVAIFERGAGITIVTAGNMAPELHRLLGDRGERARLGQRARGLFLENTGATARTLQALEPLLPAPAEDS
ncbi:MAG TPA: 3-deoxy-D-manno-octulosonic acid transferase [Candidatus Angelobacter sp.]|nr:3-deoxy-D-manno-octulosonic acid transferase [Candidatus Angelobacter sp.]